MKRKTTLPKLLLLLCGLLVVNVINAQQRKITGTITSASDKTPLPGATVVIKGTTMGTAADLNGHYEINANQGDVLSYSFVGYTTKEITVSTQTEINVALEPSAINVNEVVFIGYGTTKKNDATGSVAAISTKDFNKGVVASPQDLLTGKVAGLVVTSAGGQPGSETRIRIRGGSSLTANNDPLIVIDGMPIDNSELGGMSNPLASINPNDIEQVSILKDASATAIYGSRASNGVIIITTKKGKVGKFSVNYQGTAGIGVPIKYIDVFSGDEFRALIKDRVDNYGLTSDALNLLGDANTDWQKEIFRNSFTQDHNLSFSGSVKETPYRLSVGYADEQGILKESDMNRTTVNANINPILLDDNLDINLNFTGSFTNNDFSNTDAVGAAVQFDPTQPVRNGNTRYGGYTAWTQTSDPPKPDDKLNGLPINIATQNPVAMINYRDNTSKVNRYLGNINLNYTFPFAPQFKATVNAGYDYFDSKGHDYIDTLAAWSYREPENNVKNYGHTRETSLLDVYLNYNDIIGTVHNVNFTGGYSYQHYYHEGFDANRPWTKTNGEYLLATNIPYKREYYLISFFGRANYSLMEKYLLTATLRFDGSSRFAKSNRWGTFPAVALAWKINEESFLRKSDIVSNLKLRLGWGITGQQDISDTDFYPYIPVYTISKTGAYYQFGDSFYPTLRPDRYDSNIKWEQTTTQNIGLDFGFLNQKITGSVDVYKRVTDDLLNEIPIAAGTNFSNYLITNVGSLVNKGVEAELNLRVLSKKNFSWQVQTNFTYNQNEITKMTLVNDPNYTGYDVGDIAGGVGNKVQINNVGHPAKTFFLFSQVYGPDGMPIEGLYVDKTGDGGNVSGNNANKYYLQNPAPDFQLGISSYLTYKNFDFSFAGRANLRNYVYNNNESNMALYQGLYNQAGYTANILKAVTKTNFMTAQYWSDFYLENGSFFRMDYMTLGYNLKNLVSGKLKARINLTVRNAFIITKYSGLDPEVLDGIDNNIYPRPRTYLLGVNLTF